MSMAAVLDEVCDHLRSALSLSAAECDIRPGGWPPRAAGEFYVAIDDLGVASAAREHLEEEYRIEVAIWRRAGQVPDDRLGDLARRGDPYVAALRTLDVLERAVLRALHANYAQIMAGANAALGAGETGGGDVFQLALYYTGRSRPETHPSRPSGERPLEWITRRLEFAGMNRVQPLDVMQ